jgi:hypothetical protein
MKITALAYDWLKVDKGVSRYIKVDKWASPDFVDSVIKPLESER